MSEPLEDARRVADRLVNTTDDLDTVAEEEMGLDLTREAYVFIDKMIWRCCECEFWTPTGELKDERCYSCRS